MGVALGTGVKLVLENERSQKLVSARLGPRVRTWLLDQQTPVTRRWAVTCAVTWQSRVEPGQGQAQHAAPWGRKPRKGGGQRQELHKQERGGQGTADARRESTPLAWPPHVPRLSQEWGGPENPPGRVPAGDKEMDVEVSSSFSRPPRLVSRTGP